MAANSVNGGVSGTRSGALTLSLLAAPLNAAILRALAQAPKRQASLRSDLGAPAQTTLRTQLGRLADVGALEKHRRNHFPGALDYALTPSGRELLVVAESLERWLAFNSQVPTALGDNSTKATVSALVQGWSTAMVRALASGPLSLTELDRIISSLSYPALERRLTALRLADLVKARPANHRRSPYAVTERLRRSMAPVVAAARWERRNLAAETQPIGRIDFETVFLLTVPLLDRLGGASGSCRLAVELPDSARSRLAGVTVDVDRGRIDRCVTQLRVDSHAAAQGSPSAWLDALVSENTAQLELSGDCSIARQLVEALNSALFAAPARIGP